MIEVIAEAGVSHSGDVFIAHKLIDAAKAANADVVKFQTYIPETAINPNHRDFSFLKSLALTQLDFLELSRHCEKAGIEFMSTPGDVDSLKFLVEECGIQRIKIGSDDLTYTPLLKAAAKTQKPIILSTGMANLLEISTAVDTLRPMYNGWPDIILLHCVSAYPCAPKDANLLAMHTIRDEFGYRVGYSDHCQGIIACIAAASMGARIIEKHFELATHKGPDTAVSITNFSLAKMIKRIREIEVMMGTGVKEPCADEKALMPFVRKREDGRKMA